MATMVPTGEATARLAADLVANYGEDALLAASERLEAMEKIGNADAAEVWAAVTEILARQWGKGKRPDA
jgi:hypothetical protein